MNKIFSWIAAIIKHLVLSSIYKTAEGGDANSLDENTSKHVRSILQALLIIPTTFIAIQLGSKETADFVSFVAIASNVVGLAWFVITFAALPQRHLGAAMVCTETMFASFLSSILALFTLAAIKMPLALPVMAQIYWLMYKGAVLYDSADLLKAGLDEQTMLANQATQRMEPILQDIAQTLQRVTGHTQPVKPTDNKDV